jgi:hypothetical protein
MKTLVKPLVVMQIAPYGNTGPSFSKKPHLMRSKQHLKDKLDDKLSIAMKDCNPMYSEKALNSKECMIVWSDIEEMSSAFNDINIELKVLEDDERECWDDVECRIYDL